MILERTRGEDVEVGGRESDGRDTREIAPEAGVQGKPMVGNQGRGVSWNPNGG